MGIEGPSLVRLLDNLSDKGLILRKVDDNDRRSKTIHLSQEADKLLTELDKLAAEARETLLGDIPEKDIQTCIKVFNQILGRK